jgi:DNA-binding response OmpR family regulator
MPRASIVIIEDELSIQQLYKTKMEREGFDVYTANNGQEGLEGRKKI